MKRNRMWIAMAVFAVGWATGANALIVDLDYMDADAMAKAGISSGAGKLAEMMEPPPGDWTLPDLNSAQPVFSLIELAGQKRLLILDCRKGGDKRYNRIYLDSNGNGDLTDEAPVDSKKNEPQCTNYPPIEVKLDVNGVSVPYALCIHAGGSAKTIRKEGDDKYNFHWNVKGMSCYSGSFSVGGDKYSVNLVDGNGNGRFDEVYSAKDKPCDYLYIAKGKDKPFPFQLARWLAIGGETFEVGFDISKKQLTLKPPTTGLGLLKLSMPTTQMMLAPVGSSDALMVCDGANEIQVPAGSYELVSYRALRKDDKGQEWEVTGAPDPKGSTISVKVDAGAEAVLKFGEPFQPKVQVSKKGSSQATLSFVLTGSGNENVPTVYFRKPGDSKPIKPEAPGFKVFGSDGRLTASGSFKYG